MTSADFTSFFIARGKLAQAADEFPKQLKVCAEAWGNTVNITENAESDALLIPFCTNCRFSLQTFSKKQQSPAGHAEKRP